MGDDVAKVIIVGDGPGGLSAALFLAKNGHDVVVYGQDKTAMHFAELHNYLGIEKILGSDLQAIGRHQVRSFGGTLVDAAVASVEKTDAGFKVTLEDGPDDTSSYVILTEGKNPTLATALGIRLDEAGRAVVDQDGRSSVDRAYVVGRTARPTRSQAIISAGAGAAAALDILAREAGKDVQDWDSPPKDEE
ncbi:MAG TPA: FAD-dependent oxidoreductase [Acidimicrobiia bacterium]|jgi:thioredoxin reductase